MITLFAIRIAMPLNEKMIRNKMLFDNLEPMVSGMITSMTAVIQVIKITTNTLLSVKIS